MERHGVQQRGGGPVFLNGCYAFASFFLTREHRQYDTKDGAFGITRVRRPFVSFRKGEHLGWRAGSLGIDGSLRLRPLQPMATSLCKMACNKAITKRKPFLA